MKFKVSPDHSNPPSSGGSVKKWLSTEALFIGRVNSILIAEVDGTA
jgi:hypothetical protein